MPEDLDKLERQIRQLEIEREAIKRENDEGKLKELNTEIANLSVERDTFKAKWKEEKELVEKVQNAKADIEKLKLEAEQAERNGDYGKVAEIRYGKIKDKEKIIEDYPNNYPQVIKYKGDCPMEDCGGIDGYYECIDVIRDNENPESNERREWAESQGYGEPYDMDEVNHDLQETCYVILGKGDKRKQQYICEDMFNKSI
jgi:ATP-dependent Clp protease ATP-binding subunit ClpA